MNSFLSVLQSEPIRVLVTGAAGQIAYSLLLSIAKGDVFGSDQVIMFCLTLTTHTYTNLLFNRVILKIGPQRHKKTAVNVKNVPHHISEGVVLSMWKLIRLHSLVQSGPGQARIVLEISEMDLVPRDLADI